MTKLASFNNIRRQGGFTMVELAIVLVIAGIILAAVLKGTDMINKAKVERMTSDLRGLQGMVLETEKRTGHLAGDCNADGVIEYDPPVSNIGSGAILATAYSTNENPTTAGRCDDLTTAEADPNNSWSDMRYANVVDPSRNNRLLAKNIMSDFFAIGRMIPTTNSTEPVNAIIVYGVPLWLAKGLDVAIDGPQNQAGSALAGGARGRIRLWATAAGQGDPGGANWPADAVGDGDYQLVSISYQFDTRMALPAL